MNANESAVLMMVPFAASTGSRPNRSAHMGTSVPTGVAIMSTNTPTSNGDATTSLSAKNSPAGTISCLTAV